MNSVNVLTDSNYDEFINGSDKLVMVDFWATWCGPCKMLGPVIEELAKEQGDRITVGKLDVDKNPEIAGRFGIRGIPTVKFFKNGKELSSISGAYPLDYWVEQIDKLS
jgi:thioredoxin 1